jgi:hypothetical protein
MLYARFSHKRLLAAHKSLRGLPLFLCEQGQAGRKLGLAERFAQHG